MVDTVSTWRDPVSHNDWTEILLELVLYPMMLVEEALVAAGSRKKKVLKLTNSVEINIWNIYVKATDVVSLVCFAACIFFIFSRN